MFLTKPTWDPHAHPAHGQELSKLSPGVSVLVSAGSVLVSGSAAADLTPAYRLTLNWTCGLISLFLNVFACWQFAA